MFRHTKIFFNNNTETEYTSCGTYLGTSLCIFSSYHVATWLFNQHPSGLHHLRSVYQQGAPSFLVTEKKSDSARSRLYGGCSKMFQWNCSRSKACVCQAARGCALSCNRTITRKSSPLWQDT